MTTTRAAAARTVSSRLDTLWDFDYEPTHAELESLACDSMFARDERTGFQSVRGVWKEMGWDADAIWRDTMTNSQTAKAFNRFLFTEVLIPRLQRLGLITPRVETRYREIGLLD